jgi:hypothetical protein
MTVIGDVPAVSSVELSTKDCPSGENGVLLAIRVRGC